MNVRDFVKDFTFEKHADYCFHPPCAPEELPLEMHIPLELRPVLHLLRRDLEDLYGDESLHFEKGRLRPPFVALIGMMTGFDLMAGLASSEEPEDHNTKRLALS